MSAEVRIAVVDCLDADDEAGSKRDNKATPPPMTTIFVSRQCVCERLRCSELVATVRRVLFARAVTDRCASVTTRDNVDAIVHRMAAFARATRNRALRRSLMHRVRVCLRGVAASAVR